MNSRTPTMMRAAESQQQQQQQQTTTRTYQHSVQVHQSSHQDPFMANRSPGPMRHQIASSSSSAFDHDGYGQHSMFSQARTDSFSSMDGAFETVGGSQSAPKFVKDTSCFWYKPKISREEAISLLRDKAPGLFVVRDSNSYPGAFGLAVKVSQLPPGVTPKSDDLQSELVRHFLIEPTSKGVRLKGCANEPVFGSLAALVYQHTLTPLALPCRLVVPEQDLSANPGGASDIARQGAACNLLYLGTVDVEAMTGNNAVSRAVDIAIAQMNAGRPTTDVQFKASADGVTLTDSLRRLFFRRHYPLNLLSFCGLDPKDRVWDSPELRARNIQESRIFAVVTRRQGSQSENMCHVFSELDPAQPATAVVRFVNKHLLGGQ